MGMYGTWLQGDRRGYVKDGEVFGKNEQLRVDNESRLLKGSVRLGSKEKKVVEVAIKEAAVGYGIMLEALAVCSNHVHAVVRFDGHSIEEIVARLKNAGRIALKGAGIEGKVWTSGYDNRFCFDEKSLGARIAYVNRHRDE